jgi:origin recognition complex subunit 5
LLHFSGVPHIYFPPYTKDESIQILGLKPRKIFLRPVDESYDYGDEEEAEDIAYLWPKYCSAVWDSMGKAAARDLRSFKNVCDRLWKPFVQPIIDGQFGTRDFSKLLVSRKSIFQSEEALTGNAVASQSTQQNKVMSKRIGLDDLPHYAKFLLCAAYLASYNPARQDSVYFMKSSDRKRRKRGGATPGRPSKHRKVRLYKARL